MNFSIRQLTREMAPELNTFLRRFFPQLNENFIVEKIFGGPLLERYPEVGIFPGAVIVDEAGGIRGFTAAFPAEVYFRQRKLTSVFWGMTYVAEEARDHTVDMITYLHSDPRIEFSFCNTANLRSAQLNKAMRYRSGPASCHGVRFAVLDWSAFAAFCASRLPVVKYFDGAVRGVSMPLGWLLRTLSVEPLPEGCRRLEVVDDVLFADFARGLVAKNTGILSSRAPEVLHWHYDRALASGDCVIYGYERDRRLLGYVAMRPQDECRGRVRWGILDWAAVGSDGVVLEALLRAARRHARQDRGYMLELMGYPMSAERIVAAVLPHWRNTESNYSWYSVSDRALGREIAGAASDSWFFGPFDGDRVICMDRGGRI